MSAFLLSARRTAVAPRGGAFATHRIEDLGVAALSAALSDAGLESGQVDEVICANALGAGGNPARRLALLAGLPEHVAGLTIDRQCAGGLDAIRLAAAMVTSGQAHIVVAGGAESYSQRPLRFMQGATGEALPYDEAPFTPWPDRDPGMAEAAAALAASLGISKAAQDEFAMASHAKALKADLSAEIVPLAGLTHDAFARVLTPALAARAKVLEATITAANSAVAADAAAFVVVVSEKIAKGRGQRIVASATLGADPAQPGLAPVPAIAAVLAKAGLKASDLSQSEVMEAYAVQAMACINQAGLDPATVNLKGGALARGHPIGASGAILAVRLFHDLTEGYGLATIASAGGIGAALLVESSGP